MGVPYQYASTPRPYGCTFVSELSQLVFYNNTANIGYGAGIYPDITNLGPAQLLCSLRKDNGTQLNLSNDTSANERSIEDLARNVVANKTTVRDSTKIIIARLVVEVNKIIKDTEIAHKEDQRQVDGNLDLFKQCGVKATQEQTKTAGSDALASAVNNSRDKHNDCRKVE